MITTRIPSVESNVCWYISLSLSLSLSHTHTHTHTQTQTGIQNCCLGPSGTMLFLLEIYLEVNGRWNCFLHISLVIISFRFFLFFERMKHIKCWLVTFLSRINWILALLHLKSWYNWLSINDALTAPCWWKYECSLTIAC
jgi:hypothetical protein